MLEISPSVAKAIRSLPTSPGVYLFKDATGTPLYIGKAKSLKVRARFYLALDRISFIKAQMVCKAVRFDHIVVRTEQEALLLENTLIKEHQPPYNVLLKDDKNFRYIRIDLAEDYPRIATVRRIADSHAHYYGPYADGGALNRLLRLLTRAFKIRDCDLLLDDAKPNSFIQRPCLKYDLGHCSAPCVKFIQKEEYRASVQQLEAFLRGDTKKLTSELETRMQKHAGEKEFEKAAVLRDRLRDISRLIGTQDVVHAPLASADVIAIASDAQGATAARLVIRSGTLLARETYKLSSPDADHAGETLEAFLLQFYASCTQLPALILVEQRPENATVLEAWLEARAHDLGFADRKMRIVAPTRGARKRLVAFAKRNADSVRKTQQAKSSEVEKTLTRLRDALGLERLPQRIECVDVSHIQSTEAVASLITFQDGKPDPSGYRRFKIRGANTPDDTARMRETLRRRFMHHAEHPDTEEGDETKTEAKQKKKLWPLPDLLVLDGGLPQLGVGVEVLTETNLLSTIPVVALAKKVEEVFIPGRAESVQLEHTDPALRLLMHCRDEAHRFAITFHRARRSKAAIKSALDGVPGIGPKAKKSLLTTFGSVQGIRNASREDLAKIVGPKRTAALKEQL